MPEDKSKVDELSETLYSRTRYEEPTGKRHRLDLREDINPNESWQGPGLDEMLKHEREEPDAHPLIKKFFLGALIFFGAAVLIAGYVFLGGANFVSSKNVDITVVGPTLVSAGETFELGVTISNKNNADLDPANFSVQYPSGSREVEDTSKTLTYTQEELGEIKAGREAVRNAKMLIFGSQGEVKEIKFSVEYKVKGSNATFYKDKIYEVTIGEAPITFSVSSPYDINSGENFTTTISATLNSTESLKGVMVRAEYPYGYSPTEANPEAFAGDNVWSLGDMNPGEKKTITLRGRLVGENNEERTFRFYVGVADSGGNPNFKTVISSTQQTVTIARPSVGLNIAFNGQDDSTYIASAGRDINTSIRFRNNLPDKLLNPQISVKLSGQALDRTSLRVTGDGFYNSGSNTVTWNLKNGAGLAELAPGDNGQVNFSFSSILNPSSTQSGREMSVVVTLTGTPLDTPGGGSISVSETRTIRISSEVNLSSEALYSRGGFANKGPIPPKAETETTYTITLRAVNTQAQANNAYVLANLGQNVTWLQSSGDDVVYDGATNTVTWDIGTLDSGESDSASFQVSLTPSLSQVGTAPTLVSGISFTGTDSVTGQETRVINPAVTTRISNDPRYVQGDEYVTK